MTKIKFFVLNLILICAPFANGNTNSNLCEVCECAKTEVKLSIDCKVHVNWENVEWPGNYQEVELRANHEAKMTTMLAFPTNNDLKVLNLTGNGIHNIAPGALKKMPNLEELILSNNSLRHLAAEMLHGLQRLKSLDLSLNKLTDINGDVLKELKNLETLVLRGNEFVKIPNEVISNLPSLKTLDISENMIYILKLSAPNFPNLKHLNLSRNNLTVIAADTFNGLPMLEHLDLSRNSIVKAEPRVFEIPTLRNLDLSYNKLYDKILLPSKITWVNLKSNNFAEWPLENAKLELVYLNLEHNFLRSVQIDDDYKELEELSLAANSLSELPDIRLPKLSILNLADNQFSELPPQLNSDLFPNLKYLTLSANPIAKIQFEKILPLEKLVIDNMPELVEISGLENIPGKKILPSIENPCLDLSIANCEKLDDIPDDTFENLTLCRLNLSHNALIRVPLSVPRGVELDLQGNPFACTCELQWVLDDLLPSLYNIYPRVLRDLRCNGHRLVKWYRWKNRPLCKGTGNQNAEIQDLTRASTNQSPTITSSLGFYIVAGCSLLVLTLLVAAGMYHTKAQRKKFKAVKRNRRLRA